MVQQQISTNTFGCAKWIVSADATQGTHITIAAAITAASSGDTIFIRPGTYTENLTLKAGVSITAFTGDANRPNVTIVGKNTFTAAGTVVISNIKLQTNGDYFLSVTGNAASVVRLDSCTLICSDNTGIQYTSSSASSGITLTLCDCDILADGIAIYTHSSAGSFNALRSYFSNSGVSTTVSACSSGTSSFLYSVLSSGLSFDGCLGGLLFCFMSVENLGIVAITTTNAAGLTIDHCEIWGAANHAVFQIGAGGGINAYNNKLSANTATAVTGSGYFYQGCNVYSWGVALDPLLSQLNARITGVETIYTTNMPISLVTGTGAINIGTDAAAKTITLGNATGATSVVIDCGTGALNIGANAIARTTTVGNTTGASVLALKCGTGDFTLASATGTIISALDTGEITEPLQPAFLAFASGAQNNVTGDSTFYKVLFATEIFDQNADFASSTFTAPVTGRYSLSAEVSFSGIASNNTAGQLLISTSNSDLYNAGSNPYVCQRSDGYHAYTLSVTPCDMDAADTARVDLYVAGGSKVIDLLVSSTVGFTHFSGHLTC